MGHLTLPRAEMEFVRATVKQVYYEHEKRSHLEITTHPDAEEKFSKLYDEMSFRIGCVTDININTFKSGMRISMDFVQNDFRTAEFPSL
jgi:hypothetical protein